MATPKPKPKQSAGAAAKKIAENKTQPTRSSPLAYIGAVKDEAQRRDAKTLLTLMKRLTGEKAVMWGPSIIGFGSYRYKYESGREGEMCRIGFSPRKGQTVIYMLNGYEGEPELMARLGKYKTGKSCLYVRRLSDIDIAVLEKLAVRSLAYMSERYPL